MISWGNTLEFSLSCQHNVCNTIQAGHSLPSSCLDICFLFPIVNSNSFSVCQCLTISLRLKSATQLNDVLGLAMTIVAITHMVWLVRSSHLVAHSNADAHHQQELVVVLKSCIRRECGSDQATSECCCRRDVRARAWLDWPRESMCVESVRVESVSIRRLQLQQYSFLLRFVLSVCNVFAMWVWFQATQLLLSTCCMWAPADSPKNRRWVIFKPVQK